MVVLIIANLEKDFIPLFDHCCQYMYIMIPLAHALMSILQMVAKSMTTACKCHGVSGSCSVKTCWRSLPDFSVIGTTLKNLYANAVEVQRKKRKNKRLFVPLRSNVQSVSKESLIYFTKSPDYCSPDPKTGSVGTQER